MNACGLIVEYNPFHNGHLHHITETKNKTNASVLIAIMSGSFLQRGEPAIIDKFSRAQAALQHGVDIVVELPYPYAVQSSKLFAKGAVLTLQQLQVNAISFGSESGNIHDIDTAVQLYIENEQLFSETVKYHVQTGMSYPRATSVAFDSIGMHTLNMQKPNNILGFHYVKTILEQQLPIARYAIPRVHNQYHDEMIEHDIASATSIRKSIFHHHTLNDVQHTVPEATFNALLQYKQQANVWHHWEQYFPYLHYKLMTMQTKDLKKIHGVDEGIEHRIKKQMKQANNFTELMEHVQTSRYTTARLQRMFTHILTNTTKTEIDAFVQQDVPYIRLLGMNKTGKQYLNKVKKSIDIPIVSNLNQKNAQLLSIDERTTNIYYTILPPKVRAQLRKQEFQLPIII